MALLSALVLTACGGSTPSVSGPILLPQLTRSVASCAPPVELPATAITRAQVEQMWARDRGNLVKCGMNLEAFVEFYEGLSSDLRGAVQ